jgi:hypothetical protein
MERQKVHAGFRFGNLTGRACLEDLGIDESIMIKWVFKKERWENGLY